MKIISCIADLRREPASDAPLDTQLLYGEEVTLDQGKTDKADNGWGYVTATKDDYRGWVPLSKMADNTCVSSHQLSVLRSLVYTEADIKSSPLGMLHLNSQMRLKPAVQGDDPRFLQIIDQSDLKRGFVIADHVRKLGERHKAPDDVAQLFLHTPYFWGGRSSFGLDCSALIQLSFEACGILLPRDSGDQEKYAAEHGRKIDHAEAPLKAGDLVFWPGHVAMMIDGKNMIHANGTEMRVSIHELEGFAGKVATETGEISGVYRLEV